MRCRCQAGRPPQVPLLLPVAPRGMGSMRRASRRPRSSTSARLCTCWAARCRRCPRRRSRGTWTSRRCVRAPPSGLRPSRAPQEYAKLVLRRMEQDGLVEIGESKREGGWRAFRARHAPGLGTVRDVWLHDRAPRDSHGGDGGEARPRAGQAREHDARRGRGPEGRLGGRRGRHARPAQPGHARHHRGWACCCCRMAALHKSRPRVRRVRDRHHNDTGRGEGGRCFGRSRRGKFASEQRNAVPMFSFDASRRRPSSRRSSARRRASKLLASSPIAAAARSSRSWCVFLCVQAWSGAAAAGAAGAGARLPAAQDGARKPVGHGAGAAQPRSRPQVVCHSARASSRCGFRHFHFKCSDA